MSGRRDNEETPNRGRDVLLAFDFGTRRLGVATGNFTTRTASPLTTLDTGGTIPWPALDRVVDDWRPAQLVVGVPPGEGAAALARRVREFAAELGNRYGLPVGTVDETATSEAARSELASARRDGTAHRRTRKGGIDRLAACLIAEQWLSEH